MVGLVVNGAQSRIRTRSIRLLRTARLPFSPSGLVWCPALDSNQDRPPFEGIAFADYASGANLWWSGMESNHP